MEMHELLSLRESLNDCLVTLEKMRRAVAPPVVRSISGNPALFSHAKLLAAEDTIAQVRSEVQGAIDTLAWLPGRKGSR